MLLRKMDSAIKLIHIARHMILMEYALSANMDITWKEHNAFNKK